MKAKHFPDKTFRFVVSVKHKPSYAEAEVTKKETQKIN